MGREGLGYLSQRLANILRGGEEIQLLEGGQAVEVGEQGAGEGWVKKQRDLGLFFMEIPRHGFRNGHVNLNQEYFCPRLRSFRLNQPSVSPSH